MILTYKAHVQLYRYTYYTKPNFNSIPAFNDSRISKCNTCIYTFILFKPDLNNRLDYAHAGPGFSTWHRYLNLWFEWELQYMLESMDDSEYHMFRLPYWDWRQEIQKSTGIRSENLFSENQCVFKSSL